MYGGLWVTKEMLEVALLSTVTNWHVGGVSTVTNWHVGGDIIQSAMRNEHFLSKKFYRRNKRFLSKNRILWF
jgi:hypothetical protein